MNKAVLQKFLTEIILVPLSKKDKLLKTFSIIFMLSYRPSFTIYCLKRVVSTVVARNEQLLLNLGKETTLTKGQ